MIVLIDNYDSFTYNLVQYFSELGEQVEVHRNDKITVKQVEARARVEYQRSLHLFFEKNYGQRKAQIVKSFGYLKAWVNLLGAFPSRLFKPSSASRWERYKYLLIWYHKGCPADMGLAPRSSV